MNGREIPFYSVLKKDIGVAEALKVDSPWFVLLEWKTYCKVRGFYLPKSHHFFHLKTRNPCESSPLVLCQESTNSINFPPARWVKELRAQRAGAILQGTKNATKRCKKLKKNGEWIKLYICRRSSYYSVLLKFLMFHSIARETTNQATTQIQSPTWQVYTLFPLWVGNLLPQGTDLGIQIW